MLTFTCIV